MSEKMSVNIEVLGINMTHNYLVPNDMSVSRLTSLILQTLSEEYPEAKNEREGHMLIQQSTGKALLQNGGLKQLGIVNGETLILT